MVNYPLVSVIMPVYNGERFLREALESIRRQNYEPLEIIVVDDGSTDGTAKIISSYGNWIRYVHQANAGPAAARNRGLSLAQGELIGFLDADDLWPEGKLALQVERLVREPKPDIVMGRTKYVQLAGGTLPDIPFEGPEKTVSHITLASGIFRKRVFEKVGLLDKALKFSEDLDWFLRAMEQGISIVILKEATLIYQFHGSNMTCNKNLSKEFHDSEMLVLRNSFARRKRLGLKNLSRWSDYDEARKPQNSRD